MKNVARDDGVSCTYGGNVAAARCVVLLVLALTANFHDAIFSHGLIDAACQPRRRFHAATCSRCRWRQNCSTAQQRTTIKQTVQQFRTASTHLLIRRLYARLDDACEGDAWPSARRAAFKIFTQHFHKATRHSSSSQLDQQHHSAVSTRATFSTRSPADAAVRPLWARERARTAGMHSRCML